MNDLPCTEPPIGAVIYTKRPFYKHYGIYAGCGRVIHFAAKKGFETNAKEAYIQETTLDGFLRGDQLFVERTAGGAFSAEETVCRARAELGKQRGAYSLVFNNCEHFAHWCKYGKRRSVQVEQAVAATAAIVTTVAGIAIAAASAHKSKSDDEA